MRRIKDNSSIEGSHIARIYRPQSGVTEKINVNIDSANSHITVGSWSADGAEADECISEIYSTYDMTGDFDTAIQSFISDSSEQLKNNNMRRIKDEEEYVLDRSLDLLDEIANSCIVFLKDLNRQDLHSYGDGSIATVGTNSKGDTYVMYSDGDSRYLEDMTPGEIVETAMIIAGIA